MKASLAEMLWISVRPKHWIKNTLLFAALVFARELGDMTLLARAVAAFVVFCMLASASYLINDVLDRQGDRIHPMKGSRPVADGRLGAGTALAVAVLLAVAGLWAASTLGRAFAMVAAVFVVTHLLYSAFLQHVVIVDVFALAANYVLRVAAGAVVVNVPMSPWLVICTLLLSLFLGLSARSLDFKLLGEHAGAHRRSLAQYNPYLLDQMIAVITSAILITYTLYTIAPETAAKFETDKLVLTVPFVLYGIFRYLYLLHRGDQRLSIERALVADRPMLVNAALYTLTIVLIVYV
ncbi:MAG: decaprenyl-phosphate phosphoribosyltransferase [Deltaproteobacteria bacterium]|nr:decaprenyl-phosphate phosphoribosyltransferase [Deltaproteobacteria bacterium]